MPSCCWPGLADLDATLLKRATLRIASERTTRRASELLMDAAQECVRSGAMGLAAAPVLRAARYEQLAVAAASASASYAFGVRCAPQTSCIDISSFQAE